MLQCVAVCCSVLQCVVTQITTSRVKGSSALQCVAVAYEIWYAAVYCSVSKCVAVCCSILPYIEEGHDS